MKKRMKAILAERAAAAAAAPREDAPWPLAEAMVIGERGEVRLENRVVQAPLAGIANWAFRRQSRRHGAGLTVSEMVAAFGVHHGNRRTLAMLAIAPDEHPVGVQLLGAEPDVMAEAARAAEAAGADLVDVNMGCPVRKVLKTGAGAGLLGDLDRAVAVVEAMRRAVAIPVTVKLRRGVTPQDSDPVGAARRLEAAGAAALTFHPRAAAEEYAGTADHAITAQVAAAVSIPVIASGDITTAQAARDVMERTGCAAVAIGRGALGNPWAFGAIATGGPPPSPSLGEVLVELHRFAADAREALGEERACGWMRKFYPWYLQGQPVGAEEREQLLAATSLDAALERLDALAARALAA
jgi:nifR3 family TIM-barrel protein